MDTSPTPEPPPIPPPQAPPPAGGESGWRKFRWIVVAAAVVGAGATFAGLSVQRMHLHQQETTVLCMARQLSAAADQYYLETGVSTVAFDHLVGSSNYLKAIAYVAGESYPVCYTQGVTITINGVAGVSTVTYAP